MGDFGAAHLMGYKESDSIFINDITSKESPLIDAVGLYLAGFPSELEGVKVNVDVQSSNSKLPTDISAEICKDEIFLLSKQGPQNKEISYIIELEGFLFPKDSQITNEYNGTYNLTISFLRTSKYVTLNINL